MSSPVSANPVINLTPGIPTTLQVTQNGVTYQFTVMLNINASGKLSFSVDAANVTADSSESI